MGREASSAEEASNFNAAAYEHFEASHHLAPAYRSAERAVRRKPQLRRIGAAR